MKMKLFLTILAITSPLILILASRGPVSSMWRWLNDREAITSSIESLGIWGPLILIVLFILQVFLAFIPGQALMIACGYLYGFWCGFLISWLSLVVGGEAAFVLARRHGRTFAEKWIHPEVLARWDKIARGQGVIFYIITLVMPFVPNDAMCYVAGLGRIHHRRFLVANLLGRSMACVITSWIGAFGWQAPSYVWIIVLSLALLALFVWQFASHLQSRYYAL